MHLWFVAVMLSLTVLMLCSIICDEICSKICGCTTGLIEKLIYALNVIFVVLACVCGPLCGCISVTGCNKDKAAFESALGGQDYDPRPRRRTWGGARRIYRCIGTDGVVIRALPRESVYRAQTEAPIRADVAIDSAVVGNLLLGEAIVAIEGRMLRGSEHGLRGSLCVRCDRGWVSVTTADNPKKNPLLRLVSPRSPRNHLFVHKSILLISVFCPIVLLGSDVSITHSKYLGNTAK